MKTTEIGCGLDVEIDGDKVRLVQSYEYGERNSGEFLIDTDDLEKIVKAVFKDEVEALEKIDNTLHEYYTAHAMDVQDLLDYRTALEEAGEKMHWSHLVGRDLISDYVAEEIANIENDLEELGIDNF